MRAWTAAAAVAVLIVASVFSVEGQSGPARAQTSRVPSGLVARVQSERRVRVIVGLRVPVRPDSTLGPAGQATQRAEIAAAQAEIVGALGGLDLGQVKSFRYVPGLAIETDAATLGLLAAHPQVAYVVEDRELEPTLAQSVPLVGAPSAWALGYAGAGQTVAILDTGVDRNHPFLGSGTRVVSEACYSTTSTYFTALCTSGSTAVGAAAPCSVGCDHGTHVAGIAAGNGTLGGVAMEGVAPAANILAIQVFSRRNSDGAIRALFSDVTLGLERVYALRGTFNIASANLSLGGGLFSGNCDNDDPYAKAAVDTLKDAGIATVISSGNDYAKNSISFPACISTAISAGSTDDGSYGTAVDAVSDYSNSSSALQLLAPGRWITSSIPVASGSYGTYSGTSMAAPHVTGAWAVLKSRSPSAGVEQVFAALANTGLPVTDPGNGITRRRINVAAAVTALAPMCTYSIAPAVASVAAGGIWDAVAVTTQTGCAWSATSNSVFITMSDATGRSGSGITFYTVARNYSTYARTGTVTVAGQTFTVNQAGVTVDSTRLAREHARADFNGDGWNDLLWQDSSAGYLAAWHLQGSPGTRTAAYLNPPAVDLDWQIAGTGDFNGDGKPDILWRNRMRGSLYLWYMNGLARAGHTALSIDGIADVRWRVAGVGDFNADGKPDIVWQHDTAGWLVVWMMNNATLLGGVEVTPDRVDVQWKVVGVADIDTDGQTDFIWRNSINGKLGAWLMNGTSRTSFVPLSPEIVDDPDWRIAAVLDMNNDHTPDLVWHNVAHGWVTAWYMNGPQRIDTHSFPLAIETNWRLAGPK